MLRAVDFRVPVYLGWIRNCEFSPKSSNLLLCFLIERTKTPFHVVLVTFLQKEKETILCHQGILWQVFYHFESRVIGNGKWQHAFRVK